MRNIFIRYLLLGSLTATLFLWASLAAADGEYRESPIDPQKPAAAPNPNATPNRASDASFDKRLPPVLPGERVNDSGREKRVWSTSGPVPVSDAPEPWKEDINGDGKNSNNSVNVGEVGVIVDRRKDHD